MADATRDSNFVPTLLAASAVDGITPVRVYADPDTHRLLVEETAGGVVGPATSTDNAVVLWNGTAGEEVKDSVVIVSDTGDVTGVDDLTAAGTIVAVNVEATSFKPGGTSPVADGTYTVGDRITPVTGDLGTITVSGGIITAIQEAT